jgi:hypothetical protein
MYITPTTFTELISGNSGFVSCPEMREKAGRGKEKNKR